MYFPVQHVQTEVESEEIIRMQCDSSAVQPEVTTPFLQSDCPAIPKNEDHDSSLSYVTIHATIRNPSNEEEVASDNMTG